jgi:hypothetical protein
MTKAVGDMKACSACKVEKQVSDFNRDKSRSDGLFKYCKPCASAHTKQKWPAKPRRAFASIQDRDRDAQLRRQYGITLQYYRDLLEAQDHSAVSAESRSVMRERGSWW